MSADYYGQPRGEIAALVPHGARHVLDCGCGAGALGAALISRGHIVDGIELSPVAAAAARSRLRRLIEGRLEEALPQVPSAAYDCVICADVLEHLADPWSALREVRRCLVPATGVLIVSAPNARHLGLLAALALGGRWEYRDSGILDRTHLRFFTKHSLLAAVVEAGFIPDVVQSNQDAFRGALQVPARLLRALGSELTVAQWIIRATVAPP